MSPFLWFLQTITDFYNIWHIAYQVNLQHNYPLHPHTLGNLIYSYSYSAYIFQQDSALARRARQMIELLQRETSKFIRPQNSPDLHPVYCQIWGVMQDRVYPMPVQDVADLRQRKALSTMLLMNGVSDFMPMWMKKEASWTLAVIFRLKCTQTVCTNLIFFILCNGGC